MIPHDAIEERAELIAERARILLEEFEDVADYCLSGCPRCGVAVARAEVDTCYGWTSEDTRMTGDEAEARAPELIGANVVHARVP